MGCIVEMDDASTNTEYTIEDTTGRLKVRMYALLVHMWHLTATVGWMSSEEDSFKFQAFLM